MTQMQNKYTFTQEYTDEYGQTSKVEHVFYTDTHMEIAERFNDFLRGAGFIFNDGESYGLTNLHDEEVWTTTDLGEQVLNEYDTQDDLAWQESVANVDTHNYPNNSWPFHPNHVCQKCGMTRSQMGNHGCFEATGCGLGLDGSI